MFEVEHFRSLVPDCNSVIDGSAYLDVCGECVGGDTGQTEDWALDCNGVCFGEAIIDYCEYCVGGNTGFEEGFLDPDNDLICGNDDICVI